MEPSRAFHSPDITDSTGGFEHISSILIQVMKLIDAKVALERGMEPRWDEVRSHQLDDIVAGLDRLYEGTQP